METNSVMTAIFAVFSAIANWFSETIPVIISLFWADGALTFLGGLAVVGLGISVVFLLMHVITQFLQFRGN